jgi:murein DD-endopeptidase MepM/ murein hydrolase activator NlpD
MVTTVGVLSFVAVAATTAVVLAVQNPEFFSTSAEAASLRERLVAMEDSLVLTRAALLNAPRSRVVADSVTAVAPAPARATSPSRRASLMARISGNPYPSNEDPAASAGSATTASSFSLPAVGRIASGFTEARWHPLLHMVRPHLGVDVAAPRGTRIVAPAPGRVSFVGRKFQFGLVVEIDHGGGIMTRYAHCRSALVKVGDQVKHGQTIARVGSSGLTTGPHLHYEVLVSGRAVDPMHFRIPQPGETAPAAPAPALRGPDAPPSSLGDPVVGPTHEDAAFGAPGRPQP